MGKVSELAGRRIYADSNVFIYALESLADHADVAQELLTIGADEELVVVTSLLSLSECLVKPLRMGHSENVRTFKKAIRSGEGVTAVRVTRKVLVESARIRAFHPSCRTPDAIHLATARLQNCDAFVTNDLRLKNVNVGLPIILMSELTL